MAANGYEVSFWGDDMLWDWTAMMVTQLVNALKTNELYT